MTIPGHPGAEAAYDGNLMAGPLSELFALDVTVAVVRCRGCGSSTEVATLRVYGPEPGLVGRCPGCDDVLLRVVRTPDAVWLDLGGVTSLRVPAPRVAPAGDGDESART
ncbi:DUF6510 family protein [Terrabacter sp. Soil810]|uniref:DUF6510 family protein n=1 Tax=Terrabacter sp. Soil810 TaxID=1736418 RepID=UPI00070AEFE1|nr:DUF6510 family protein [Terrabacter sp. Soil810]KRF38460.1 hypothetical protein ASG96_18700 [Terrabacter sp. Soil810]